MKPVDPEAPLAQTVAALGKEVRDLRAWARMRAVIEQAKGVLVERHGITLDEAFARLRRMSQEHNVRVVEVAATVVGVAIPEPEDADLGDRILEEQLPVSPATSRTWRTLREQPDVRAGVVTAVMDAVASSTDTGHEAAELVLDLLEAHEVAAVTIYRKSPDGSLRLVGQVNVPGDLASSWRSIPPSTDIPMVRSILDEAALFWGDREERLREYPQLSQTASVGFEATGTVPVVDHGEVVGVIGLIWQSRQSFDDDRRAAITRAVQRVAPLLMRNLRASDPELEWLNALMGLHLDPWLLLDVVVDSQGAPSGLVVQDVAAGVAGGQAWLGRRVLEIWPFMAQDGTREALMGLARTGGAWSTTINQQSPAPWGSPGSIVRAVRLGQRIALLWRAEPA